MEKSSVWKFHSEDVEKVPERIRCLRSAFGEMEFGGVRRFVHDKPITALLENRANE